MGPADQQVTDSTTNWLQPASVFDKNNLPELLKSDLFPADKSQDSTKTECKRTIVLFCPSLETMNPNAEGQFPIKERAFHKVWVDAYGESLKREPNQTRSLDILFLLPWLFDGKGRPPSWIGFEHLLNLFRWIQSTRDLETTKAFGEVAASMKFAFFDGSVVVGDNTRELPYAFGVYFDDFGTNALMSSLRAESTDSAVCENLLKKHCFTIGTSIGEPFGTFEGGQYKYKLMLHFDSAMARLAADKTGRTNGGETQICVVREHLKIMLNACRHIKGVGLPGDMSQTQEYIDAWDLDYLEGGQEPISFVQLMAVIGLFCEYKHEQFGWAKELPADELLVRKDILLSVIEKCGLQ